MPRNAIRSVALLSLIALGQMSGLAQKPDVPFESDIEKFEAQDAKNPPAPGGIVFVGSSSIVRWKTLKEDFPGYNVINRGFGGSQVSDSVRFADRIVTPYKPTMIVFFAGTNDIAAGKSADTVFHDYKAFVDKVRVALPSVTIAYISISPAPSRWSKLDEIKKANGLIQAYSAHGQKLLFVDTFPQMLTADGGPRPELFVADQLHLSPKGYAIWVNAVRPILPKLDDH
jgi:lysophospholipase L1-like esterase